MALLIYPTASRAGFSERQIATIVDARKDRRYNSGEESWSPTSTDRRRACRRKRRKDVGTQIVRKGSCETVMATLYRDTHPKIEALQIDLIRDMPPWKKLAIVDSLNETVRTLAISGIRQRHPQATPDQVRRMLAEMVLGVEIANKVYGHAR